MSIDWICDSSARANFLSDGAMHLLITIHDCYCGIKVRQARPEISSQNIVYQIVCTG